MDLNFIDNFLKTSFLLGLVHLPALDAGLLAGERVYLEVHHDGDDLVAKALLGEPTDLSEVAIHHVDQLNEQ